MTLRACSSCGVKNRVLPGRLADTGRCGRCKTALPPLSSPLDVDEPTFSAVVAQVQVPVLVDFWAPWCGPCRAAAPAVARVASDLAGRAVVLKVNSDEQPALAQRFSVRGIPHFVVLKGGRPVAEQSGLVDAATLKRMVESAA